ncbi:ABC transporter permease [Coraliomargarita sp. SDUM461004]|uniref:ABC transporter permease n=1 Tax=Thalassobacterium sedimentorum TaxID=3041258 RepID=A0ABU1ALR0_9BACT|nr:ABC transporter permease [Coraliomargarita sp. SDUM461004]MDQ8195747.1 ABC transporter permease [Coraliomargarita sp. SDUM461004]
MPWYIYHALKQLFPSGRFFSFFSLMSIMGVMLGVCVLIIVQSVMNGFGEGIRQRLTETQGDIRIRSSEVIYDWEDIQESVMQQDAVVGASPFAEGVIMLQHQNRPQFPFVRGVEPWSDQQVVPLEKFLTIGQMEDFDDDGVFLGEGLAYALKAGPGSIVEVFTPLMLEALKQDEVLLPREFKVVGLFRTGSPQVDGNTMITTLRVMQELYGLGDGVHGIVLKLRPGQDAYEYSVDLEREVLRPGLDAVSWIESNQDFLFVIAQEKRVISFIIIFIILVASFSIAIALMMAVIRKTREIGLLVAMGGRPHQVAYSFCFQGFIIGFVGTAMGILMALVCLHYRRGILSTYAQITNTQTNFLGQYDVYEIPVHFLASDFIIVTCFALVISTLAGLLPALRAARLKPADALRSE